MQLSGNFLLITSELVSLVSRVWLPGRPLSCAICEHICSLPSAVNTFWFIYLLARETYMTRICFDSYAIVSDMSAAGLGLNKFCYAGLITAFKNKTPTTDETMAKVWYTCVCP